MFSIRLSFLLTVLLTEQSSNEKHGHVHFIYYWKLYHQKYWVTSERQNVIEDSPNFGWRCNILKTNVSEHWNVYITICKIDDQCKFNAWSWALKASAVGQPRGMGWGGRRTWGFGIGGHVHPWPIHVDVWQKPPEYYSYPPIKIN